MPASTEHSRREGESSRQGQQRDVHYDGPVAFANDLDNYRRQQEEPA